MTLSAHERRILAEMAHRLSVDDPGLAGLLGGSASLPRFPVRLLAVIAAGAGLSGAVCPGHGGAVWLAVIAALSFALAIAVVSVGVMSVGARRPGQRSRGTRGPVGRRSG